MPSILVIEDSPLVQRLVAVSLSSLGLPITVAKDGPAGVAAAEADIPSLVVLDIGLPGFDGWEVLRRLRAAPATRSVPVLVLTAHAQPENRDLAWKQGADGFMTKPFEPTALRSEVSRLLSAAGHRPSTTAVVPE
jgi:CheY-like chemotaxis protein